MKKSFVIWLLLAVFSLNLNAGWHIAVSPNNLKYVFFLPSGMEESWAKSNLSFQNGIYFFPYTFPSHQPVVNRNLLGLTGSALLLINNEPCQVFGLSLRGDNSFSATLSPIPEFFSNIPYHVPVAHQVTTQNYLPVIMPRLMSQTTTSASGTFVICKNSVSQRCIRQACNYYHPRNKNEVVKIKEYLNQLAATDTPRVCIGRCSDEACANLHIE